MRIAQRIVPCLWFDEQAEEAARFYTSIFDDARILHVSRYGEAGYEIHHMPEGSVMTVEFEIAGQKFTALNGGPAFQFNEAVSLQVYCESQEEIDYYWDRLSEGGDENAQQCGWLKDKFGLSWQITHVAWADLLSDPASAASQRAMNAVLRMKKPDVAAIRRAYDGVEA